MPFLTGLLDFPEQHLLLAYIADLELEVDRLRKRDEFLRLTARDVLRRIRTATDSIQTPSPEPLTDIRTATSLMAETLRDLQDAAGYHPAHDQVVAVAIRPMIEQVFRWQQRLTGNAEVGLKLEAEVDHVDWFPARLRHILDNLISNGLRYRDPVKAESWVRVGVRSSDRAYEFRVTDNGMGLPSRELAAARLLSQSAPIRSGDLGVGLAVVKALVEQSGGEMSAAAEEGRGSEIVLTLPRYDIDDYLV